MKSNDGISPLAYAVFVFLIGGLYGLMGLAIYFKFFKDWPWPSEANPDLFKPDRYKKYIPPDILADMARNGWDPDNPTEPINPQLN